jgi:RHS repeat-associated protein
MTNTSGSIAAQSGHFPFGEYWYETTPGGPQKLKFTSYERDSESGNDYAIFRSYLNRFGRFASPDPYLSSFSEPQRLNRFFYVASDPINQIDPLGLYSVCMPYILAMDGMPIAGTVHMHCWPAEDTSADRLLRERINRAREIVRQILEGNSDCASFLLPQQDNSTSPRQDFSRLVKYLNK